MALGKLTKTNTGMKTIGVAGSDKGVGVTHFCITSAELLRVNGFKVAVLEANNSLSFQELADNLNLSEDEYFTRDRGYEYDGIDFYFNQPINTIASIKSEGYDYLIIDMGLFAKCDKSVFNMATFNIIVASSRLWNFSYLIENVCNDKHDGWGDYTYVFPFARENTKMQAEIKDSLEVSNIYFPEYNEDPFKNLNVPEISKLFGLVEDTEKVKEKKSFFGFKKKQAETKPLAFHKKGESKEPEVEEFEVNNNRLSIDDLKNASSQLMGSQAEMDSLVEVLAQKEYEEASRVANKKVYNIESKNIEEDEEETNNIPAFNSDEEPNRPKPQPTFERSMDFTPKQEPEPKPEPKPVKEPDPVYVEEAEDLSKTAGFIACAVRFDVVKNNKDAELLTKFLNKNNQLALKVKERNIG